jgi:hypothetical protein
MPCRFLKCSRLFPHPCLHLGSSVAGHGDESNVLPVHHPDITGHLNFADVCVVPLLNVNQYELEQGVAYIYELCVMQN